MRGRARLAVLAALILGALLVGCGSGGDITGTIPQDNANELKADLDAVQVAIEGRHCQLAHKKVDDFLTSVDQLPEESGAELKDALREVGDHLDNLVDPECNPAPTTTGASGETGVLSSTTSSTTTKPPPETTDTSTTSSTTETTSSTTTQAEDETSPSPNSQGGGPPPTSNAGGNSGGNSGGVGGGSG